MKGNLKKAVIMLMSLGFALGLALGKIQDDATKRRNAHHYQSIILHTPSLQVRSSGFEQDLQSRLAEKLRRVEELQRRAMEKAERVEKLKWRSNCH